MKKIVSAALVASMVAGAFAADAKITLNMRTKLDAYSQRDVSYDGNKTTTKEWMDWAGYDGAGKQAATNSSDTFKIVIDGEQAGVTLAYNVANSTATNNLTLNQYSAWMKWNVGPGTLKLESGNWKDGYADGAYRVKKDVDAMNAEGTDFERFKLGSILKGSQKLTFVDDLGGTNSKLFSNAAYDLPVNDQVSLNILLGSVSANHDKIEDGDTTTYYDAYFVSRLQAKIKDVLNAEFIFKNPTQHVNDYALYVMPQISKALTLNIGGAVENDNRSKDDGGYTDWAFDVRARFQANDALSLTLFTNLSGTNLDAGRNVSAGIAGRKGAYGWAQGTEANFGAGTTAIVKVKTAMWNHIGARYVVNETLAATLNVGLITPIKKIEGDDNKYGPEWRVVPAVQVYAGSNASIWTGVALSGWSGKISDKNVSSFNVDIPVIFRVKM